MHRGDYMSSKRVKYYKDDNVIIIAPSHNLGFPRLVISGPDVTGRHFILNPYKDSYTVDLYYEYCNNYSYNTVLMGRERYIKVPYDKVAETYLKLREEIRVKEKEAWAKSVRKY